MTASSSPCAHLTVVTNGPKPAGGCAACLALGDTWVHLRFCLSCGEIGCCNQSKNRHASKHATTTGHPVARSREPEEMWAWCYPDEDFVDIEGPEIWG